MGNFNRDNRFGGGFGGGGNKFGKRDFGGKKFGGGKFGGGFEKPQMHDAICSECGSPCQVPFRPTGDREVFCSNCFKDKRGDRPERSFGNNFSKPRFDSRPSFDKKPAGADLGQLKQQIETINSKLDRILRMLPENPAVIPQMSVEEEAEIEIKKATPKKSVKKKAVAKKKK